MRPIYRGTSLIRNRPRLGPYNTCSICIGPYGGPRGGGRFLMSEVPLCWVPLQSHEVDGDGPSNRLWKGRGRAPPSHPGRVAASKLFRRICKGIGSLPRFKRGIIIIIISSSSIISSIIKRGAYVGSSKHLKDLKGNVTNSSTNPGPERTSKS